ncbi:latexin isoform 2-T2 [Pholidichthys leucotaenia]
MRSESNTEQKFPLGESLQVQEHSIYQGTGENVMETSELNPNHYPARRAAQVVQHYLNSLYGSPYQLFRLQKIDSGFAEEIKNSGRKYRLEILLSETLRNTRQKCTAEVLFPMGEGQHAPKVHTSCEELLKVNTKAEDEALYQQYKTTQSLLSAQYLPDSHGRMAPEMKPFWHLAIVASSVIMLDESTENTLYNMAQVANITQLATENDQLRFDCHTLLHDMVSQEIIHWKLLFTWSPSEGVKVLQRERLPHRHECENTN